MFYPIDVDLIKNKKSSLGPFFIMNQI